MPILGTEEQREIERMEEWQDRDYYDTRERRKQEHELNLAKLKYATQPRHKAVARVAVGVAKVPALMVLALTLPLLVICGKEIPKPLADFLSL